MSIFDQLGRQPARQHPQMADPRQSMNQALDQMRRDPRGMIQQAGLSVPENMTDPRELATYLMDSGQVGGPRLQMARNLMARMGLR